MVPHGGGAAVYPYTYPYPGPAPGPAAQGGQPSGTQAQREVQMLQALLAAQAAQVGSGLEQELGLLYRVCGRWVEVTGSLAPALLKHVLGGRCWAEYSAPRGSYVNMRELVCMASLLQGWGAVDGLFRLLHIK